jgi:spore maturation protein CgeB
MGEWPNYLKNLGIESIMLCKNNFILQNTWCMENDFTPKSNDIEFEIILEQTKRFNPDILFIFGASYYAQNNRLERIVSTCSHIKKKVCWYGAPEGNETIFHHYDLVLTNSLGLRDSLRQKKIKSEQLNHAFESKTLSFLRNRQKKNRICFAGSLIPEDQWHTERIDLLEDLADKVDIEIYSDINRLNYKNKILSKSYQVRHKISKLISKVAKNNPRINFYSNSQNLPSFNYFENSPIKRKIQKPSWGIDMLQNLSDFLISLNLHISQTGDHACNMRLFESTGVGSCLLTDYKPDLKDFFSIDDEVVTYRSKGEAIDKSKFLLGNPEQAAKIGLAAQKRTLKDHNTEKQVDLLVFYLKRLGN